MLTNSHSALSIPSSDALTCLFLLHQGIYHFAPLVHKFIKKKKNELISLTC